MEKKVFILEVSNTCKGSWQGSLNWVVEHKKQDFQSMLEMLRLIDSAISEDSGGGVSVSAFPAEWDSGGRDES